METVLEAMERAVRLHQAGRMEEAEQVYRMVLTVDAGNADAWHLLGVVAHQSGRFEVAIEYFQRALAISPQRAESYFALGTSLRALQRVEAAAECYRQAIEFDPQHVGAWINLGNAMKSAGSLEEAIACYQRALVIEPENAIALSNLGNALKDAERLEEALACHQRAVALQPTLAEAHSNLGTTLRTLGRMDEAIACYRRALEVRPTFMAAHSNLLYSFYFTPGYDTRTIYEEHRKFDEAHAAPLTRQAVPHANERSPQRRLKIGYVSPHFREHVLALFLTPLLESRDRELFEVTCYSDVVRSDDKTQRLRASADVWQNVAGLLDEQLAERIRAAEIDILVDLTMHMEGSRPLLFARKPAPVQACWFAYPGTTGLSAMDYRMTDRYLDPPGMFDAFYSEKSVRLPDAFWCYDPLTEGPAVGPLPATKNEFITFGSLNSFSKMNEGVLALWGRVMAAVPASRLLMLAPEGSAREWVLDALAPFGVHGERVTFVGRQPRAKYLELYQQIDIGVDTIPANGHTTSLDALWMGVPVVTLVGQTAIGRGGVSILQNLGQPELIAQTPEQYVEIVLRLASDIARLAELRQMLRGKLEQSPLMDRERFARGIEGAYREMWREWCGRG
jgi:protein O-GlcNAc transferase